MELSESPAAPANDTSVWSIGNFLAWTAPLLMHQAGGGGETHRHPALAGGQPRCNSRRQKPKLPAEREPEPEELRDAAIFWLTLSEAHLDAFTSLSEEGRLSRSHIPAFEAQPALERAFKGLLSASNDSARLRRDAAVMWRHSVPVPAVPGFLVRSASSYVLTSA